MSFCALPVFLAFLLNRCSIRFFTTCRCILGFTPFSASLLFGFSLVALLVKHPELYPCWLRRVNWKLMFLYELFASLVFIEIGFCVWNSLETLLFYRIPSFLEENCGSLGDFYIRLVESEVGVSLISNSLALMLLMITLHITRICNFNLLLRHHREARREPSSDCKMSESSLNCPMTIGDCCPPSRPTCTNPNPCRTCISPKYPCNRGPKTLRSGKKFY